MRRRLKNGLIKLGTAPVEPFDVPGLENAVPVVEIAGAAAARSTSTTPAPVRKSTRTPRPKKRRDDEEYEDDQRAPSTSTKKATALGAGRAASSKRTFSGMESELSSDDDDDDDDDEEDEEDDVADDNDEDDDAEASDSDSSEEDDDADATYGEAPRVPAKKGKAVTAAEADVNDDNKENIDPNSGKPAGTVKRRPHVAKQPFMVMHNGVLVDLRCDEEIAPPTKVARVDDESGTVRAAGRSGRGRL